MRLKTSKNKKSYKSPLLLGIIAASLILFVLISSLSLFNQKSRNQATPVYCEGGRIYENLSYNYKICLPANWIKNPKSAGDERVLFNLSEGKTNNFILINVSSDYIENALQKYTKNVYVDVANRNYQVDGVEAIQVSGSVKPAKKRAITVFTKDSITYEISLENDEDATYTGNLETYKKIVESFKFTTQKQLTTPGVE